MAILPPSVDYTDKDFDALRQRLIALIGSTFPDWSDFSVASFGNVLVEMYAFVGDVLAYYLDNQARESRLATATQRKNVITLARMLGFKLQGAQAAKANVALSLQAPPSADVTLPAGTIVRTQEVTQPARFQLLAPVVISAGTSPPLAVGVAGSRASTSSSIAYRTWTDRRRSPPATATTPRSTAFSGLAPTIGSSSCSSTRTIARRSASAMA